jgi:gamma-glutamyltranspeptidase/glutathione hydrolase
MLLHHLHLDMSLQQALDAPLFDTDHVGNSFWPRGMILRRIRGGADRQVRGRRLDAAWPHAQIMADWSLGWVSEASREGQRLTAAASPRGLQTYAIGR